MLVFEPRAFPIGCGDATWPVIGHGVKRRAHEEEAQESCALRTRLFRQIKVVAAESTGGAKLIAINAVAGTPKVEPHVARR